MKVRLLAWIDVDVAAEPSSEDARLRLIRSLHGLAGEVVPSVVVERHTARHDFIR